MTNEIEAITSLSTPVRIPKATACGTDINAVINSWGAKINIELTERAEDCLVVLLPCDWKIKISAFNFYSLIVDSENRIRARFQDYNGFLELYKAVKIEVDYTGHFNGIYLDRLNKLSGRIIVAGKVAYNTAELTIDYQNSYGDETPQCRADRLAKIAILKKECEVWANIYFPKRDNPLLYWTSSEVPLTLDQIRKMADGQRVIIKIEKAKKKPNPQIIAEAESRWQSLNEMRNKINQNKFHEIKKLKK